MSNLWVTSICSYQYVIFLVSYLLIFYFKSVGNLAKGNYNKDICGYFLDSLIGEYKTGDKGNKEIIKFLIDHGVNMNSTFKAEQPTLL